MNHRKTHERRFRIRNPHDRRHMIIHLQSPPQLQRLPWIQQFITRLVDQHTVRQLQIFLPPHQHPPRQPDHRTVIQSHGKGRRKLPPFGLRRRIPLEQPHRILHPNHSPHPVQIRILERFRLLKILRVRIHHPNIRIRHIQDLTPRPLHDPTENAHLVLQQKSRKRERKDQPEILRPIRHQHLKCNVVHE